MIEYQVRKIERYEVTRYSENADGTAGSCEVVASDLPQRQADDIAGAMFERCNAADMVCKSTYADGREISNAKPQD
jgi:hypothetical protein